MLEKMRRLTQTKKKKKATELWKRWGERTLRDKVKMKRWKEREGSEKKWVNVRGMKFREKFIQRDWNRLKDRKRE